MNREEGIAFHHLRSKGFKNIEYEPDGNIPPDFVLDGVIAVEVRRLNQHFAKNGNIKSLEVQEYPLLHKVQRMLSQVNNSDRKRSYFVSFHFSRPLRKAQIVVGKMKEALKDFLKSGKERWEDYRVDDCLSLNIFPASERHEQVFLLGGYSDHDSGGFLVSEIHRNLKICLAEKTKKIQEYRSKYSEWWLLLIDYIGYGLSERDLAQLREIDPIEHTWDKVILVAPLKPEYGVEI